MLVHQPSWDGRNPLHKCIAGGKLTEIQLAQYKTFASPFAKVFLGAIFTYQVIYWTWLKLEMDESKFEKNRK